MTRILVLLLLLFSMAPQPVYAEGGIGDNLRQHFKERLAQRAGEKIGELGQSSGQKSIITPSGDYNIKLEHDGLKRVYLIHVPSRYNPKNPMPLVFAFHGGGGDMDYMAHERYGLKEKADKAGFIVVFPNGYSRFKSGKFATWNAGTCCANARDKNIDDVGFIKAVIKDVSLRLNVDRQRIFATGMSNGGMISYRMACELTDIFKAIASVAGTDSTQSCKPSRPISIMHIHAKDDDHVLFRGGAGEGAFKDPSKVTDFASVPATISKWVRLNDCQGSPKRVKSVNGAYCEVYDSCQNGVQVKLCVTETGGHSWPGGTKKRAKNPPSNAISANDEIWNFFQSQK